MRRAGLILFIALPVLYCVLYAPFGFDDTDQGFVQALSWRILLGEIPCVDFDYVRPPLTPYLHALEMWILPHGYEVIGARCGMYLMLWASVLLTALSFKRLFAWADDLRLWLVCSTGFVLTAHNYPAMPWHTTDGVFFVSLGIFFLSRNAKPLSMVLGMLALVLSALCKQPFALMPLLALPVIAMLHGRRALVAGIGTLLGSIGALLAIAFAIHVELPGEMLRQSSGVSSGGDLFEAGVLRYGWGVLLALPMIGVAFAPPAMRRWAGWMMPALVLATAFAFHVWRGASTQSWVPPSFHFFQALWVAAAFHAGWRWMHNRQSSWLMVLLALAGAWASGISWGYQTPALYSAPIWFTLILLFSGESHLRLPNLLHASLLLMALLTYGYLYQFPYRDEARSVGYVDLGQSEEHLQSIHAGPAAARKLSALRNLVQQEPTGRWTVFPSMPLAHYLHNSPNPIPSDWEHNAEMAQGLREQHWRTKVNSELVHVYVERDKLGQMGKPGRYDCMRCESIRSGSWQLADPFPESPFLVSTNFGFAP